MGLYFRLITVSGSFLLPRPNVPPVAQLSAQYAIRLDYQAMFGKICRPCRLRLIGHYTAQSEFRQGTHSNNSVSCLHALLDSAPAGKTGCFMPNTGEVPLSRLLAASWLAEQTVQTFCAVLRWNDEYRPKVGPRGEYARCTPHNLQAC